MNKTAKRFIIFAFGIFVYSGDTFAGVSPSFDCAKATTEVEKLICSDDELAKLDIEMNKSYHAFMKTLDDDFYRNKLKKKQIDWLGYRGKLACFNTDNTKKTNCLKNAYQRRIENLNAWTTRKNYDFFIDYPDYYEQKDWVGYRKPIGKFISKLGDEYYINCTTHTIFPKFPEEKVYFADTGAKFPGNVEIIYQTEDFIYFQCANVSDMLADQSPGEFFPGLLNAPLNKLASYPISGFDHNKAVTEEVLQGISWEPPKSSPVFSCTKEKCTKIPNNLSILAVLSNSNERNKKIEKILELGGDINEEDAAGWTPLYFVLFYALDDKYGSTVNTLLSHGANINYINSVTGNTLVSAISSKCNTVSLKQLKILHTHGFDLNTRTFNPREYYGENPTLLMSLISLAIHNKECLEKVKYLLKQDVNVNAINYIHENEDHKTVEDANALFYALNFNNKILNVNSENVLEITKLLIQKGVNKKFVNSYGHDALYFLESNEKLKKSRQYQELKKLLRE